MQGIVNFNFIWLVSAPGRQAPAARLVEVERPCHHRFARTAKYSIGVVSRPRRLPSRICLRDRLPRAVLASPSNQIGGFWLVDAVPSRLKHQFTAFRSNA